LEIGPRGDVVYRQRVWGNFSQALDLRNFPMDRQVYAIQIMAAGYTTKEVELVPDQEISYGVSKGLSLPDWKVEGWNAEVVSIPSLGRKGRILSLAEFSFAARRKLGYYVIKVIIPLIMIVAMSWVVFWIDPTEGGVQIGVSMTAMLTLIAYRFAVGAELPKVSYVTRMDLFLLGAAVLIFTTLMEVIVTSTLARGEHLELARRIDRWARVLFPLLFALIIARAFLV
jgi:preprotein translocase subunit SecE